MTRSGFFAAAAAAIAGNGQALGSRQFCTAFPSMRQPVSPITATRLTAAGGDGTGRPPTVIPVASIGSNASQTWTGKASLGAPRGCAATLPLSLVTAGQASLLPTTLRTARPPSAANCTQATGASAATA